MFATLASIKLAHLVTHGVEIAGDKPFVEAGNEIVQQLGKKKAQRLFDKCAEVIKANPYPATYESMIAQVKEG